MITMAIEREPASALFVTEADRWAAVVRRDPAADTVFYYSVRTTGVYCRPSCAARRPRRENVLFHPTCAAAEAAGFRPCKRCRPNEASLAERWASAVRQACRLIQEADPLPGLDALAASVGMSRFHFHRVFKAITGLTPRGFATAHRADRVRDELTRSATVTDAIYGAGFNSHGRFYAASSEVLGMTPTDFRSGGNGTAIRFAVGECSLGAILVAATDKGVCAICSAMTPRPWCAISRTGSEGPTDRRRRAVRATGGPVVGFVEAPALGSICRSTCVAPRSNIGSGRRCVRSRRARPRATARSQSASACRRRCAPWRRPVPRTLSPSPFPAIAWCAMTVCFPATDGVWRASARCSTARASHDHGRPTDRGSCLRLPRRVEYQYNHDRKLVTRVRRILSGQRGQGFRRHRRGDAHASVGNMNVVL